MPTRDLRAELDPKISLPPNAYTTAANGAAVDLAGAESALILLASDAFTGTAPTATLKVQESDTSGSGYTDVADSDLIGVTGNTSGFTQAASTMTKISYIGAKRYVRVILTAVGGSATPTVTLSANVVRGHLRATSGQPV